jgi:hypothetical protein
MIHSYTMKVEFVSSSYTTARRIYSSLCEVKYFNNLKLDNIIFLLLLLSHFFLLFCPPLPPPFAFLLPFPRLLIQALTLCNGEVVKILNNRNGSSPSMGDDTKEKPLQHIKTYTISPQAECQSVIKLFERAKSAIYIYIYIYMGHAVA